MYNKEIGEVAFPEDYEEAKRIANSNRIIYQCQEYTNKDNRVYYAVRGTVQHRGVVYETILEIDKNSMRMMDFSCSCDAYMRSGEPCIHCVALFMEAWSSHFAGHKEKAQTNNGMVNTKTPVMYTDRGFKTLLTKYETLENAEYIQQEKREAVKLVPYFKFDGMHCTLEFKIGISHLYVMKDMVRFAQAVIRGEMITYGKKLELIPHRNVFEPESIAVLDFLIKTLSRPRYSYGYSYNYNDQNRVLTLDVDSIDSFMKVMEARVFDGEVEGDKNTIWRLEDGTLPMKIRLAAADKGITFKGERILYFLGYEYGYFFADGVIYRKKRAELLDIEAFLEYQKLQSRYNIYIADMDMPAFCRELLPALERHFAVDKTGVSLKNYYPKEAELEIYLDMPERNLIVCELYAVYDSEKYNVFATDYLSPISLGNRNKKQEMGARALVEGFFNVFDPAKQRMVLAQDEELLYRLLTIGIPEFSKIGAVFVSDKMKALKVIPSPKIQIGVSLSNNLLELQLDSELSLEQLSVLLSKYDRKKRYYRLKDGSFVDLGEETGLDLLAELKDGLALTAPQIKSGRMMVPGYRALYLDAQLKGSKGMQVKKDKGFRTLIRNMKTVEDSDFEIPKTLDSILREYQKRGFLWLKTLCANGFGGILADDMGLGKTLQVIAFLMSEDPESKTLIVCPASLVYNWKNEFARFAPDLKTVMVVGTAEERRELIEHVKPGEILITSYDLLKRDIQSYEQVEFFCQVLDEAQYIKNHGTQAAQASKSIASRFRLALTGTPIENSLSELWSIFDFLMPGFLYSYQKFKDEIEQPIIKYKNENAMERLQKMIGPFILRRLKKDVLSDLPDKMEKNTYAILKGEQERLYKAHVQRLKILLEGQSEEEFSKSRILVLSELTKLRQLCCDPALLFEDYRGEASKLELCLDLISNAVESGHKVLLFSQFTSMLSRIQERLKKEKIEFYSLTGETSKEKRMVLVEEFQNGNVPVFCISLKAGGTGLNLTAADIVIHFDPWWNAAAETQASDRAHRIGQRNVVTVYKLIAKDTVEEKIVALQDMKRQLADQVLGGGTVGSGSFSREELLELLAGE